MKAGVIGTGHLGYHHARLMKELADEVKIFDTDQQRLENVSKELGIEKADSLEDLVNWSDAIDVSCTTSAHYDVVLQALDSNTSVLVEKPIAATVEQGEEMVRLAEEKELILAVGHIERFNPAMVAASKLITKPIFMEGHRMAGFSVRCTDVSVVMDLMIHDIDLVLWQAASPVAEIHASGVPVLTETVDICNARILFENGAVANLTASRISTSPARKLRFFQRRGYISVDFGERKVSALKLDGGSILPTPVKVKEEDALAAELNSFLYSVQNKAKPAVSGLEGLMALRAADTILKKSEKSLLDLL